MNNRQCLKHRQRLYFTGLDNLMSKVKLHLTADPDYVYYRFKKMKRMVK